MRKQKPRLFISVVLGASVLAVLSCSDKTPGPSETKSTPATPPSSTSAAEASPSRVQEALEQLKTTVSNAKQWREHGHSYKDLAPARAVADGIFPKQMLDEKGAVVNPWKGPVSIDPVPGNDTFCVVFSHVPVPDCVLLYSQAKSLFTVNAGTWGTEPANEEQAKNLCGSGNIWFIPK